MLLYLHMLYYDTIRTTNTLILNMFITKMVDCKPYTFSTTEMFIQSFVHRTLENYLFLNSFITDVIYLSVSLKHSNVTFVIYNAAFYLKMSN